VKRAKRIPLPSARRRPGSTGYDAVLRAAKDPGQQAFQEDSVPSQAEVRAESWRDREPSRLLSADENAAFDVARKRSLARAKKLGFDQMHRRAPTITGQLRSNFQATPPVWLGVRGAVFLAAECSVE